ncbi:hypothetical protein FCU45_05755 [Sulfurimonas crateris]|uniref:Uncharacterized protein n=1 Tax=Sulfurimonas crateris TaxID=2574727 RepID=A0A4U2Z7U2_9BACT|nr:hypothetical protein [Sulfurimonas crateris]TKI69560.1 hypothetical protein FCU45_05755 [Sulfurimonas crateris]
MQEEFIEQIEPTPTLHSKKCRFTALALRLFVQYTTIFSALASWYLYDYFIALLALVLAFIIMGIIRSKIRNTAIPFSQREYQYSDREIAEWYTAKMLCYEESA